MTRKKQQQLNRLKQLYGQIPQNQQNDFEDIQIYHKLISSMDGEKDFIDDITWNDLEMDSVFRRINSTKSYLGEQILYHHLHRLPTDANDELEKHIEFFDSHEEKRLELEYTLHQIGKNHADYCLPAFLMDADVLNTGNTGLYRILQLILAGSLLGGIFLHSDICIGLFILTALINLVLYTLTKSRYESCLSALLSTKQMVLLARKLASDPECRERLNSDRMDQPVKELNKLTRMIGNYQSRKRSVWTGDIRELLRDYLIGITLQDFVLFRKISGIISGKLDSLLQIYEYLGRLDMEISVASFRRSLPFFCKPEFLPTDTWQAHTHLSMTGVYHPLLEHPVSNDLALRQNCIIIGSNASGKSTFMKAVAINALLGGNIRTCAAKSFTLPPVRVVSSMSVRDDVLSGESYYIRELKYLKRILDGCSSLPSLCIIDEILRGTNTQERLAASMAVLNYLTKQNCIVIAATHDAELARALTDSYCCYHFRNYIENGKITFDYKIHRGLKETRNAIALLRQIEFPEEVIREAERLCGQFSAGKE